MTKTNTRSRIVSILLVLVMLLSLLPTTAFAAGSAETTDITEIKLTGDYQHGNVPAGILPAFNPGTTTDSITIDKTNSDWVKRTSTTSLWGGFAGNTPVAYNDGKTYYGYSFAVDTKAGYQLASDLKVIYNGVDVTSTAKVSRWAWGAYVDVDLGKAIGENPTTHTVTFNSNGGTEIAPKEVVSGVKIKAPSTPTKDKYIFRGWYEDSTFNKEFDFNTPITSDITLYANWEAANSINEIRLAGDIQYGTVQVGTLPSFNPRATTDSITIDEVNSNWQYKMQNGAWSGFGSETPTAVNDGKTNYGYSFCVKTNDGYQLDYSNLKVFYNEEEVTSSVKISKYAWGAYVDVDLGKANGTPVVYTITFNSNDGTSVAPQNVNAGEKLAEPTPAPTKVGFTFDGWYEDSTFSKKFDFNTPITDSMTLYAKWTENKYTLTFDANGGTGSMTAIADLTGEYTLPANEFTAPSGKQFKGWSLTTDGAIVTKVDMTENRTVYAIWENIPVVTYTVSFDANGGIGTMADVTGISGEYTLPANGFTAPAGKQFKAWSVGGVEKAAGDTITVNANTTVTAIWENIPVVTYTVSFDANGGTGSMADVTGVSGEYTLPANGFTAPAGKQFKAWSVGGVEKAAGDKITVTANTTVTAVWEAIEYNVTVTGGTASVGAGTPITKATMGTTVTLTANAAPSGKVFDKWEVVSGGITLADANSATTTFTMPASAVSVKATYKNAPHTHTYNQETVKPEALKTPADCTHNAVYFKSCSCGAISTTDTFVAMNTALGHAYGSDWKYDSTNHWHECSRCHDKKDEAAHSASEWIIDTAATETAEGAKHKECTVCKKVLETATIPATGSSHTHSYGTDWKYDDTNHWHECECGDKADIAAHSASEWIIDTAATETAEGAKHKECTVCKKVLETATIPATGSSHTHSYGTDWKYDDTNHWHECECGDKADIAAHSASEWIIDTAATETAEGAKHKECTVCKKVLETATIPATGSSDTPSYGVYVGMTYTAGNFIYQITSIDTATVGQSKVIGVVAAKKNKIKKVTIPDRADCKGYRLNVTAVGDNAFAGCKALKKLTIGNKVTVIGKNAFKKCSKLETVVIGKAVKTISSKAFIGDNKIKKITFKGKKLKTVNKNAFSKKVKKNIKSKKTKLKGNKKAIKLFKKKLKIK